MITKEREEEEEETEQEETQGVRAIEMRLKTQRAELEEEYSAKQT